MRSDELRYVAAMVLVGIVFGAFAYVMSSDVIAGERQTESQARSAPQEPPAPSSGSESAA